MPPAPAGDSGLSSSSLLTEKSGFAAFLPLGETFGERAKSARRTDVNKGGSITHPTMSLARLTGVGGQGCPYPQLARTVSPGLSGQGAGSAPLPQTNRYPRVPMAPWSQYYVP